MTGEWLAGLEASALARALRDSVWVYPLVNAAHIFGVSLLLGAIVPLDLRLLGAWRSVPLAPLWRVLRGTAVLGLVLAMVFGALLFMTRATEYAMSDLFLGKMAVIALGIANALALSRFAPQLSSNTYAATASAPRGAQIAAGISLLAWTGALTLGRLVGYF